MDPWILTQKLIFHLKLDQTGGDLIYMDPVNIHM